MADQIDQANDIAEAHTHRAVRAAIARVDYSPLLDGNCDVCGDEDVKVRRVGGRDRCTPCRAQLERRR